MIQLKQKKKISQVITDEELEFLATRYIKLQQNPEFQRLSKQFQDFVNEYLQEELLAADKLLNKEAR